MTQGIFSCLLTWRWCHDRIDRKQVTILILGGQISIQISNLKSPATFQVNKKLNKKVKKKVNINDQ